MPIKSKARRVHLAVIARPDGSLEIELTDDEAAAFNADPDAWAARHFGLTIAEYIEWMDLIGAPLCGALTKAGKPCKNLVGRIQMSPQEWKAAHRESYCASHG